MSECNYRCELLLESRGGRFDTTWRWDRIMADDRCTRVGRRPVAFDAGPVFAATAVVGMMMTVPSTFGPAPANLLALPKMSGRVGFYNYKSDFWPTEEPKWAAAAATAGAEREKWRQQQSSTVPDADVGLQRRYKWFPPDFNEMWITHSVNGFVYVFILFLNVFVLNENLNIFSFSFRLSKVVICTRRTWKSAGECWNISLMDFVEQTNELLEWMSSNSKWICMGSP